MGLFGKMLEYPGKPHNLSGKFRASYLFATRAPLRSAQPERLRQQWRGPGLAARRHQPQRSDQSRHHASVRRSLQRQQPHDQCADGERHDVRDRAGLPDANDLQPISPGVSPDGDGSGQLPRAGRRGSRRRPRFFGASACPAVSEACAARSGPSRSSHPRCARHRRSRV